MKKILTILRNQPTDSSDLKLINTLRDEAKRERLNDSQKIDFKIESINQERPNIFQETKSQVKASQLKLIYAFGFTCLIITLLALIPQSKLTLLIPGEREKLERQLQAWNQLKDLKTEIQTSLLGYKNLSTYDYKDFKINWHDNLPGFQAISSLVGIKDELFYISPFDNIGLPKNEDFKFLYQNEWNLIKESFLNSDLDS